MYRAARASLRRRFLASSVWVLAATAALPAAAAPDAVPVDVAAGTLDSALTSLATQTRQQVLYTANLVANRRAPALKGAYTPDEALNRLLAGSGIVAKRTGPNVIVLQSVSAASGQPIAGSVASRPFVDDEVPEPASSPSLLDEVTVTGTSIRGAPPASPVRVFDQAKLESSGQTTLADALRAIPENFGGLAAEGNTLTGADGVGRNSGFGTALNLRGLGNGATLVLVNGRRVAGSGSFSDFVDISTIPTVAVERVEVLLDGASAIYGSDAVGGVVNIILRKPVEGVETRLLAGIGTAGEPAQGQISQTLGHRWADGGFFFAYELQRRDALRTVDRDFSRTADLRSFGGSDFRLINAFPGNVLRPDPVAGGQTPGFAIPAGQTGIGLRPGDFQAGVINLQNQREGHDLLPRQTLNSVYLVADQTFGRLQLNADARYSSRRFKARSPAVSSTFSVGRNNPFFVSPNGAAMNSIAYSFAGELENPLQSGIVETLALTFGGAISLPRDWRVEAYGSFGQEIGESRASGFVNSLILNEALGNIADRPDTAFNAMRDGFFNPYAGVAGANPAGVLGAIRTGGTWNRSRSRIGTLNVQADGTLLSLPGGPLKLAVGAQARRETLVRTGMNYLSTAAPVSISNATDAERDVVAAFAELRAPIVGPDNARAGIQRLSVSLAGRIEHYDVVGTTANPSVGVVWAPVEDLQLRATYNRSFRAPALREGIDPPGLNPVLLSRGAARVRTLQLTGGNPDLKPETAKAWTTGFDFNPERWPGLKISATLFDVRFRNRVGRPASVNSANALVDPTLSPFVRFISPATNPADLALITEVLASAPFNATNGIFPATDYGAIVDVRYVNTTTLHVRGVDTAISYAFDLGDDRVSLGANLSYMLKYTQQFTPTSPVVDTVNVANFPLRLRGRATADWTRGRLTLGGAVNYTGRYRDSLGDRIGAFASLDLQARLAPADRGPLKDVAVLLNVRNAFDKDPPFYNNSQGFAYDAANADPIGRFVSLQLTRTW